MEAIFRDRRDSTAGVWFDYDLAQGRIRRRFFPVNIFPLLLFAEQRKGSRQWERDCHEAIQFLKASGALEYKGGIPSSMARGSIETWDFPNGEPVGLTFSLVDTFGNVFPTTSALCSPDRAKSAQMCLRQQRSLAIGEESCRRPAHHRLQRTFPPETGHGWAGDQTESSNQFFIHSRPKSGRNTMCASMTAGPALVATTFHKLALEAQMAHCLI